MPGVRLHEISWVVKGKEPRPTAKVPKCVFSGKDVGFRRQDVGSEAYTLKSA